MPLLILSVLLQVALVLHIVKTGRNTTWIWIVTLLPVAGGIAYIVVEVLPSIMKSNTAQTTAKRAEGVVDPNKSIRKAAEKLSIANTIDNQLELADELFEKESYKEAVALYRTCLRGAYESDPDIMVKLARAQFYHGEFEAAKTCLDELIELNPEYKNADAHLLYARCLNELNDVDAAIHEYQVLSDYYPGPEANYRFALMLINLKRVDEAREYLESNLKKADQSAPHYSSLHKEWLTKSRNLLKAC